MRPVPSVKTTLAVTISLTYIESAVFVAPNTTTHMGEHVERISWWVKQLSGSYPGVTNAVIHNTFKDRFVRPLSVSRCIPKLSGPSMEDGRLPRLNKAPPEVSNLIIYLCLLVCSGRRRRRTS